MADYNLEPGEVVVAQAPHVALHVGDEREPLDELVLTDRNLILVATVRDGLFRQTRYVKRCPLRTICLNQGSPQVVVTSFDHMPLIQVAFRAETVVLQLADGSRRSAELWAERIRTAAASLLSSSAGGPPGAPVGQAGLFDRAMGAFGTILGASSASPVAHVPEASFTSKTDARPVTAKCMGCHAPLTGPAGSAVTCGYCGTKQTL